jgi:hypothetical protein
MASYIGRRKFLATLGGAAVACPLAARAQQSGRLIRLGFLGPPLNNPASTVAYERSAHNWRNLAFAKVKTSPLTIGGSTIHAAPSLLRRSWCARGRI